MISITLVCDRAHRRVAQPDTIASSSASEDLERSPARGVGLGTQLGQQLLHGDAMDPSCKARDLFWGRSCADPDCRRQGSIQSEQQREQQAQFIGPLSRPIGSGYEVFKTFPRARRASRGLTASPVGESPVEGVVFLPQLSGASWHLPVGSGGCACENPMASGSFSALNRRSYFC